MLRLPARCARGAVDAHFTIEGYEHIRPGSPAGKGVILALPHLGGWEWAARVDGARRASHARGRRAHRAARSCSSGSRGSARRWASRSCRSVPTSARAVLRALRDNRIVCLLCDRDLSRRRRRGRVLRRAHDAARRARRRSPCAPVRRCCPSRSTFGPGAITTGWCGRRSTCSGRAGCAKTSRGSPRRSRDEFEALIRAAPGAMAPAPAELAERPGHRREV